MRTTTQYTLAIGAFAGSLLFASCTNTPAEQKQETDKKMDQIQDKMLDATVANTPAAWEKERADILQDLRDLRDNIDKKLTETNVTLTDKKLKPSERTDAEALKAELTKEKASVEDMVQRAENATDATWSTTKADIKKGSDDVKSWWARLKENVDKKTKSDNDNDGH